VFYYLSYYYVFVVVRHLMHVHVAVSFWRNVARVCLLISKEHARKYPSMFIRACQLYGCEIRLLTLREESRLSIFENRVLKRIFGPKRDEVTGEWRKLHNEELNDLYSSPNNVRVIKSRRIRWAGHVARMGESRGAYRILVRKPKRKKPLERLRHRWNNNIKMDLGGSGMWEYELD